ncbi:unnamed protein product [Adineta ricciae]|uniref:Phosphatidylinositol transfer protein N-terminal domain-containing protein n=1 Tax=Adineta ricciae TaxID=249248 RepID=A0A813WDS9_ADIRI|nr:unnamed protein product [Adineta ricciae]
MKLKEYRIPMPLSLDEYHLGQQWTEIELLKETLQTCATHVTMFENITEQERMKIINDKVPLPLRDKISFLTPMTHRQYQIKDQKSKFFNFVFFKPKTDLVLDEYSWDSWPYTLTIVENLENSIRIIVQSYCQTNSPLAINQNCQVYFPLNTDQMRISKDYEIINVSERLDEKRDYRIDEDPTRNISLKKPNLLPLELNSKWYENQSSICVYKIVELMMLNDSNEEKSFLSKATNKIIWSSIVKTQRMLYHRFHQKMLCDIDQWIDKTMGNVREEERLLRKFLLQHQQTLFEHSNK